jgi:hypothetical protein
MNRNSLKLVSLLGILLLSSVWLFGQAISGDLVGAVRDADGAFVPNANVEARNLGTGATSAQRTNAQGEYHFVNLPAGHYSVTATAAGMKGNIADVEVVLNHTITANITTSIAGTATTVEVSGTAASIDTSTQSIENTFGTKSIADSPSTATGSGVINLSLLNAGVATSGGIGLGTGPSISGQRPRNNNFTVEGVDNNSKSVTGPLIQIPNDAVESFTVLQNQFTPEFGHSSGGQFNQIVKSGTNQFHGTAYEYFQNRNLNAQDSQTALAQVSNGETPFNPRYDNNRFGGQFGGPVIKNKLFFFTNWEYQNQGTVTASSACSPTAAGYAMLTGMQGVNQTNLQQFQKYVPAAVAQASPTDAICIPTSSVLGATIPVGDVGFSGSSYYNNLTTINSVDWNISANDSFRGRLGYEKFSPIDTAAQIPTFWLSNPSTFWLVTLSEYHNFTPNVANEFRFGFNRNANTTPAGDFLFPGLGTFPNINIIEFNGIQLGADGNAPQFGIQNLYQFIDNVSWVKGKHTLKFGGEFRWYISPQGFTQRARGDYEWNTFEGYLTDIAPDYFGERSVGSTTYYGNQKAVYGYGNDQWRVSPELTLNLGLRYEFTQVPLSERQWQPLNAISNVPGVITFGEPQSQKTNFLPRLGFNYAPGGMGNTSIRGGFGMAVDVLYDNLGLLSAPPQKQQTCDVGSRGGSCQYTDLNFLANGGLPFQAVIPPTSPAFTDPAYARASTAGYIPNQQLPYSESWNLGVQHAFGQKYTLSVSYVGTKGIHLPVQDRINRTSPVSSTTMKYLLGTNRYLPTYLTVPSQATLDSLTNTLAGLKSNNGACASLHSSCSSYEYAYLVNGFTGNVTSFQPYGASNYNGMQTQFDRNFSNGLQFRVAYTWSHAFDNSTADVFSTYLTPRRSQNGQCIACDWSTSALDRRHRLTLFAIYDLPFFKSDSNWLKKNVIGNWQFTPIYTYQSPEYATVNSQGDSNLNGDSAGDRAIYNPLGIPNTGSNYKALKNTAGATVAYLATNPTAQYIRTGPGGLATTARNTLAMPVTNDFDFTIMKRINITERQSVQVQAEFFNLFNHPQYLPGNISDVAPLGYTGGNVLNMLTPSDPSFNQPSQVFSNHPRQMVLVLKYSF